MRKLFILIFFVRLFPKCYYYIRRYILSDMMEKMMVDRDLEWCRVDDEKYVRLQLKYQRAERLSR